MTSTANLTRQAAWAGAIAQPAPEFSPTPLSVLEGAIPDGLRGSLYRNGPGRLHRGDRRVGHWFDGDGAILAVHFTNGGATGVYRYVQSAGYADEQAADQFLYSGYGTLAPGPIWQRWKAQLKNAANTSVLALPDKLLALWEAGHPHQLDLQSLETHGLDDLGDLSPNCTYSAHPKRDAATGEIYNFGLVSGANATLNLYRSDRSGKIQNKADIPLNGIPLIHDFVLAGPYLVFCVPPVRMNALPAVFGLSSFSDALMWQPKHGTQIVVVERDSFDVVSWGETDPWYQWHFGKGYQDFDGNVVLDVVRYDDFKTNQFLKEVATGEVSTEAPSQLWQIRINPQTGKVLDQQTLVDRQCEYPVVPEQTSDRDLAPTYLSVHSHTDRPNTELFNAIAKFDPATSSLTIASAGEQWYPSEPIYARDRGDASKGWVLTVVYDSNAHQSEVWIYDCDRLADSPVCRLALPSVIPHSFHGTWQAA
ncbi:MAG: carotenoid oxygenase family protein [Cyanobacteria bacterium J06639_16]